MPQPVLRAHPPLRELGSCRRSSISPTAVPAPSTTGCPRSGRRRLRFVTMASRRFDLAAHVLHADGLLSEVTALRPGDAPPVEGGLVRGFADRSCPRRRAARAARSEARASQSPSRGSRPPRPRRGAPQCFRTREELRRPPPPKPVTSMVAAKPARDSSPRPASLFSPASGPCSVSHARSPDTSRMSASSMTRKPESQSRSTRKDHRRATHSDRRAPASRRRGRPPRSSPVWSARDPIDRRQGRGRARHT